MKVSLRELLLTLLVALLIFGAVRVSVHSYKIDGPSMEPSFHNGQYLLVNKASYHLHSPRRGDVVVFHYPLNPSKLFIKRVIGLPGEHVEINQAGNIYIDGALLKEEPDIGPTDRNGSYCDVTLKEGEYFVLGDNRSSNHDPPGSSSDSRAWGPVPEGNIIGKTWVCYWPLNEWGLSPSYSWTLE